MYAIEFETDIRQGMIRIPVQYLARLTPHVKVILLQEEEKQGEREKQSSSFSSPIDYDQYFGVTNIGQATLDRHLRRLRDEWERECI